MSLAVFLQPVPVDNFLFCFRAKLSQVIEFLWWCLVLAMAVAVLGSTRSFFKGYAAMLHLLAVVEVPSVSCASVSFCWSWFQGVLCKNVNFLHLLLQGECIVTCSLVWLFCRPAKHQVNWKFISLPSISFNGEQPVESLSADRYAIIINGRCKSQSLVVICKFGQLHLKGSIKSFAHSIRSRRVGSSPCLLDAKQFAHFRK